MKYIGLDLGSVTCGISISETGLIAQTVETLRFPKDDYDVAIDKVKEVIAREKPDVIVLGYPLLENGDVGPRAMISEDFAKYLRDETGLPVYLQDERNTTQESEAILLATSKFSFFLKTGSRFKKEKPSSRSPIFIFVARMRRSAS